MRESNTMNKERLQKYMAECGVASRRKAEELIAQGRVRVNGKIVTEQGVKVDENDLVQVDGKKIEKKEKNVYIKLYKPVGVVTTASDQFGRKTVLDLIDVKERIYPVGRLDYDTSGLLILTNDGALTRKLTHPSSNTEKTYIALTDKTPSKEALLEFSRGMEILGRLTAPATIEIIDVGPKGTKLKITIHEGRNRQIRRMCEKMGCKVKKLKRISVGSVTLGALKSGQYAYLTDEELEALWS